MSRPPDALAALVARFDPDAFDAPDGAARIRLEVAGDGFWDALVRGSRARLVRPRPSSRPDAAIAADAATWERVAADLAGGMDAFRSRRLRVRRNLHLGVGFLAATSGDRGPGRLRFRRVRTSRGTLAALTAGEGPPVLCLHGLGGTKASFLPTVAALAPAGRRVVAVDLPGFGDSDKPLAGSYDPEFFAAWAVALLDELEIGTCDVIGHSLGGRAALELGFLHPGRVRRLVLLTPSLAWLRERRWAAPLRLVRPELGLLQPALRPLTESFVRRIVPGAAGDGWSAAGVDEFLRAFHTPRGRAAFYAAARQIYLEDPERFWSRLRELAPESLFVWGTRDALVPTAFMRHVERALPAAEHVEVRCGHVPQLERPRETHAAIGRFLLRDEPRGSNGSRARGQAAAPRTTAT